MAKNFAEKLKKTLALVLALAMVVSLTPLYGAETEAATAAIKASTSVYVKAANTIKVTGVTKQQYVKIVVTGGAKSFVTTKQGTKTLNTASTAKATKVNGTGKALTFKATASAKAAGKKYTATAYVFNAKTNKQVKKSAVTVAVYNKTTSVKLNATKKSLNKGSKFTLKATVKPAKTMAVTWKSSKTSVATVTKKGVVTAKAAGTAKITATSGGKSATCTVTVSEEVASVKLNTVTPKPGAALTATAANADGKTISANVTYAWTLDGAAVGSNSKTYTVPSDAKAGAVIEVTATSGGKSATAKATVADVSCEISYNDAAQADGSYLVGKDLSLTYGSGLGTPAVIKWYKDNAIIDSSTTSQLKLKLSSVSKTGKYYAEIQNTDGETFKSNTIELVDAEVGAEITDFQIVNDTDTADGTGLDFAAADTNAVVSVTLNHPYDGKFWIFEASENEPTKAASKVKSSRGVAIEETGTTSDATINASDEVTKSANFTAAAAIAAGTEGKFFENSDKSVTYMFQVNKDLDRGTEYKIIFDQDAEYIKDDLHATDATKNGTLNVGKKTANAPYIAAPTTITLESPTATKTTYTATLKNADGDAYTQMANSGTTATTTVYTSANKPVGSATTFTNGVASITGNAAVTGIKYHATFAGDKGIYGKDEVKVSSEEMGVKTASLNTITPVSANDVDVTVNFTLAGVQTAGKIYITSDTTKFDATKDTTYDSVSAAVAKGDTSAKITSAVKKAGAYTAIFVPDDTATYGNVASSEFTVSPAISEYAMGELNDVVVGQNTAAVITAKDQFGTNATIDTPTVAMIPVNEKDSTIVGATENITNTAAQSAGQGFVITAGSNDGKWRITTESSGTKPTKNEVWVGQMLTAGSKKTNSYLVATCDSAGASYDASTWTLQIVQVTGAANEIVPETGKGTPTKIVDSAGNTVTKIDATGVVGSADITLYDTYYVVDQFGNKIDKAADSGAITGSIKSGHTTNTLKFTWNSDGKITKAEYNVAMATAGTDISDPDTTYGATVTITVGARALASNDVITGSDVAINDIAVVSGTTDVKLSSSLTGNTVTYTFTAATGVTSDCSVGSDGKITITTPAPSTENAKAIVGNIAVNSTGNVSGTLYVPVYVNAAGNGFIIGAAQSSPATAAHA